MATLQQLNQNRPNKPIKEIAIIDGRRMIEQPKWIGLTLYVTHENGVKFRYAFNNKKVYKRYNSLKCCFQEDNSIITDTRATMIPPEEMPHDIIDEHKDCWQVDLYYPDSEWPDTFFVPVTSQKDLKHSKICAKLNEKIIKERTQQSKTFDQVMSSTNNKGYKVIDGRKWFNGELDDSFSPF